MKTYISLLRGINVGGRIVKMSKLRTCYENTGCQNVVTLLQSGNVIFNSHTTSPTVIQRQLESAVSTLFNFTAKIFVYLPQQLSAIIKAYPFDATDEQFQHYIVFLRPGLATELAKEVAGPSSIAEATQAGNDVIYWQVEKGKTLQSPFAKILIKPRYKELHTSRNIKTLRKLIALSKD